MVVKISPNVQNSILTDATIGKDTPLKRKGEKFYVKHDCITIQNAPERGVNIEFSFKGVSVVTMNVDARLTDERFITIGGIKGKQRVELK